MQTQLYAKEFYPRRGRKITKLLPFPLFALCAWGTFLLFFNEFIIQNELNDMVDFIACFLEVCLGFIALIATYYTTYKIVFFYKIQSRKHPVIAISEEGITMYGIITGKNTLIEWQEIQFFLPYGFSSKPYAISIAVYNPKLFIAKEKNILKKLALKRSISKYKAPYVIFPGRLDTEEDLYNLLNGYLQNNRMNSSVTVKKAHL